MAETNTPQTPAPKTVKITVPKSWGFFEDRTGTKHPPGAVLEVDEALAVSSGLAKRDPKTGKVTAFNPDAEQSPAPAPKTPMRSEEEGEPEDLSALTVQELKDRARAKGVEGFNQMTKGELVKALEEP